MGLIAWRGELEWQSIETKQRDQEAKIEQRVDLSEIDQAGKNGKWKMERTCTDMHWGC